MHTLMQVPLKCFGATAYVLHTGGSSGLLMDLSKVLTRKVIICKQITVKCYRLTVHHYIFGDTYCI